MIKDVTPLKHAQSNMDRMLLPDILAPTHAYHLRLHHAYHLRLHIYQPDVPVHWHPPQRFLHYQELYRGIYEYLREPPQRRHVSRAVRYLRALKACYHPTNTLQGHRILWTQAWLDAVDDPEDSDAETVFGE
jgi:hypothetical protein